MFGWTTDIVLEPVNTALEAEKIHTFSIKHKKLAKKT
jgi:hypothetical protein